LEIVGLISIGILMAFSFLAFWKMNSILFIILGAIAMMVGLQSPDIISGLSETTPTGLTIGLMVIVYAFLCIGIAFRLLFWKEPDSESEGGE